MQPTDRKSRTRKRKATGTPISGRVSVFNSLTNSGMPVLSVSATRDGLATPAKVAAARPFLPSTTEYLSIAGGNHAQFGWYGPQRGDQAASTSREEQTAQTVEATVRLLSSIVP